MKPRSLTEKTLLDHISSKFRLTFRYWTKKFPRRTTQHFMISPLFGLLILLLTSMYSPGNLHAQGLEISGGWTHSTGDFGLDGFEASAGWFFTNRVELVADYDGVWDTSRVGAFELTSVGVIISKAHLQNFLVGPRIFLKTFEIHKHSIIPFGEAQFGVSHLSSTIQEGTGPSISAADTAFSWMLGAGVDYSISPHWAARGQLGFLRTHLNDQGQSRLRIGIGVAYTFGKR